MRLSLTLKKQAIHTTIKIESESRFSEGQIIS